MASESASTMFSGQPGAPFPGSTLASWTAQNLEGQVRRTASLITGGIQVGVQSAMNPGSQIVNPAMGAFNTLGAFASNPSGYISAQYNSFTKSLQTPEGIGEDQVNFGVFVASLMMPGEGGALEEAAAGGRALRVGEITTYQDFVDRSVVGDRLEGHELWQHANLNENGLATTRLSTLASQMNPVIVLDQETHLAVNVAQRAFDARAMTPAENIAANSQILRNLNAASPDAINAAERAALNHAAKYGH